MTDLEDIAKAERVRAEAASLPTLDDIRDLADRAVAHGGTELMTLDDIRDLGAQAVAQAEEVNTLLRRLITLLPPAGGGDTP